MFDHYVKELYEEPWDTFQIKMLSIGGNKRFYEFMLEYSQEKNSIETKYNSAVAFHYRKMLCFEAKGMPFTEAPPYTIERLRQITGEAAELASHTAQRVKSNFTKEKKVQTKTRVGGIDD